MSDWVNFYSDLFTSPTLQPPTSAISESFSPNQVVDSTILEAYISSLEVDQAISYLKRDTAPGNDNLPPDLFLDCVDILQPVLTAFFQKLRAMKTFPASWLSGILRPIYKKKGEPTNPEFYRPIMLTSCLYKIFANILLGRSKQMD